MTTLALLGGDPVRADRIWPAWPEHDEATEQQVLSALRSTRWTISWPTLGRRALERCFATAFAEYNGAPYCVATDHGSSALVAALEALDVGPGDEVVVPAMTWVAPASAVLRVGALPVLADVDPQTGCLTAETIRACLGERTRAIIVVHLACTVADLDEIPTLLDAAGVALIEDCAQAHGARWRGRPVGTFGRLGAFSFQQGKVLASGEGGAVLTADPDLFRRLQQLRADARAYGPHLLPGQMEIVEIGEVTGANYCLSEIHAAIAIDQLARLDDQHARRERCARYLEAQLAELGAFGPIPVPEPCDRRSIYEYGVRYDPAEFPGVAAETVAAAVTAEIGHPVFAPDPPLFDNLLFRPLSKRRFAGIWTDDARRRAVGRDYPGCAAYGETTLLFHHAALLGDKADMDDIVKAIAKVRDGVDALRDVAP